MVTLGRTAKEVAAEIGEMLIAVKAELKHGEFKPWVEQNLTFSYRKAREYKQVAETKLADLRHFQQAESVIEVLSLNRKPKPKTRAATLNDLRKVERLRALRDDPSATEGEKQAAQRKLDEIEKEIGPVEQDTQEAKRTVVYKELAGQAAKVVLSGVFESERAFELIQYALLKTYGTDEAKLKKLVAVLKENRKA